jgi:chemotaxis regulatin CheY-phosphate phosphatase CheZ
LIDLLQHGLDGWRVVPEQDTVVFDWLDDLSPSLKLFLRALGEADVDALYEIHASQLLDDVLHGGRRKVVEQRWNDYSNGHIPRRAQNSFFHAAQVFIDQVREGWDDVLLKVGHGSA